MPRLTKQQKPPTRPPAVSAATITVHAKRFSTPDVPALLVSLADRFGIKPSDVPTFPPALPALRKAKLDLAKISPATIHHAGNIWRAGINDIFRRVDKHNTRVLKRYGDENRVAVNGEVRLASATGPSRPAVNPRVEAKPSKPRGVEILGLSATQLIRAAGRAGFTFAAVRAALDELGGIGVSSVTIRMNLSPMDRQAINEPTLTVEQLTELEPFRDAKPEPKEKEQRLPHVVVTPRSVEVLD